MKRTFILVVMAFLLVGSLAFADEAVELADTTPQMVTVTFDVNGVLSEEDIKKTFKKALLQMKKKIQLRRILLQQLVQMII